MKPLGLIGGTSWHSTIEYYRYINQFVEDETGTNPQLMLHSLDVSLMRRGDWDEIREAYRGISKALQEAGAQAILICANTPHKIHSLIQPELSVPILHIADATAEEARRLEINSLGLLGTLPVMEENFIIERLEKDHDLEVILPDKSSRHKIHSFITEDLTKGIFKEATKAFFIEEMSKLEAKGANGIVLGCTELPLLIRSRDYDLPLLDTTFLHAKMAADFILSE